MLRLRLFLLTMIGLLIINSGFAAAGEGTGLYQKNTAAHLAGSSFFPQNLFHKQVAAKHLDILTEESILQLDPAAVSQLYTNHPESISLTLHTDDGKEYSLELLKASFVSEQPNMGYIDAGGRHRCSYNPGIHYQGIVSNTPHSMAALSVFDNGDVMILFANSEGNFVLGKLEDGSGNYILYNDRSMKIKPKIACGTTDAFDRNIGISNKGQKATASSKCSAIKVYWEAAYKVYTAKGSSLVATQNYLSSLFNQFATMYANEQIPMELKSMYVWIATDDYPASPSSACLYKFAGYWNALNNGFDGDIAHLITHDNNGNGGGNGGIAYLDVLALANRGYAYGYSDIYDTLHTVPTYSWDVEVLTHETGHNVGSHHTHWCGWNTGTGGTCGAIDDCTTIESSTGCTSCSATNLNSQSTTAWTGTVMSYCHLVARGINLANGFGTLPGAVIRTAVINAASTLSPDIAISLVATPICTNDGAISLSFPSNNHGVSPYNYTWSNNSHNQNLTGINTPGSYSVQVTDANSCVVSYSANIIRRPNPGNGITPSILMPICCNGATTPLHLNATVPTDLTSCQAIKWIRSGAAFTSFSSAKSYFDTSITNVLNSTNSSSISATTGASLDVSAPASCASKLTYYYTPVVVQVAHPADSFMSTVSTNSAYQVSGTTIGKTLSLPDQTGSPSACDLLDTPSSKSLSITVSGYTGRASNMRLVITNASGTVIYEAFGLTGNGTYQIPASAMQGDWLQGMTVFAFDFNCTVSSGGSGLTTTCTTSTSTGFSASRKVVYGNRIPTMSVGCAIGNSIKVDFSPNACTKLAVNSSNSPIDGLELFPNPATQMVSLRFSSAQATKMEIRITDILGKQIATQEIAVQSGKQERMIDIHNWARGVYIVHVTGLDIQDATLRLIVQ